MTAHELARLLLSGPDIEVRVAADSHDHWRTVLALPVRSADRARVRRSEYHRADELLCDRGDEGADDERGEQGASGEVVVIR